MTKDPQNSIQIHLVFTEASWSGGVGLPPLGAEAVLPAHVGTVHEAADVVEELAEAHAVGVVDGVVKQRCPPEVRMFTQQDTVQAGQALLSGVGSLQTQGLPALRRGPGLEAVVHPPQVVGPDLVAQHPLEPELPSPRQVYGQRRTTVLHHHDGLRQQLIGETHHHLSDAALLLQVFANRGPHLALGQDISSSRLLKVFIRAVFPQYSLHDPHGLVNEECGAFPVLLQHRTDLRLLVLKLWLVRKL